MASKVDSSGLSVTSEGKSSARKPPDNDDFESVYSNHKAKSAYGGGHKKKHPLLLGPGRQSSGKMLSIRAASKNNLSEFTQRIMSAKLLRTKQVQNQLNETQNHLNELINENRVLRTLLKRQEGALKKYEGNHAELPQLIRSHNEEIRALKANNKLIKAQLRESNTKLKDRESELEALKDNYNKLKKLSTEKNLLEREKLQKKVEEMQEVIKEQEEKIQVLSRKVLLESKNYRHHLNVEVMKHKETQKDLTNALTMISKLERELMFKEKQVPGGKILLKRENKNLNPVIFSKSTDMQPKMGASEDSFLSRIDGNRNSSIQDSPEPELELLNCLESSDDTSSPLQDIFPEINGPKKPSPEVKTSTEVTFSKSEMLNNDNNNNTENSARPYNFLKSRRNSLSKKKPSSKDPVLHAREVVETLKEDMETINHISQKVHDDTLILENKDPENLLLEELKMNAKKLELSSHLPQADLEKEDDNSVNAVKQDSRRNVPKRKLEDERDVQKSDENHFDDESELTKTQQQKLVNMTKTWNDMKSKIQEERKKAEEKIKELHKTDDGSDDTSSELGSDRAEELLPENDPTAQAAKDLKFINFTDDAYILKELEKTDKIFNKLRNDTRKQVIPKTSSSSSSSNEKQLKPNLKPNPKPRQPPDIKNFRTESKREPKYLEEFQTEYQKQNLLKALKAIDFGRDPNLSTDESDGSEHKKEKQSRQKNGLKRIKQLSSESDKSLMAELFGSKHRMDKSENLKLEYGTVANE